MKALEIRRKVTQEVFKEAMRKGKFGITYIENLVSRLGGFLDFVMIEAANLKRLPQYSHSTFNLRAKTVIEDSQVVQLVRYVVSFYCETKPTWLVFKCLYSESLTVYFFDCLDG